MLRLFFPIRRGSSGSERALCCVVSRTAFVTNIFTTNSSVGIESECTIDHGYCTRPLLTTPTATLLEGKEGHEHGLLEVYKFVRSLRRWSVSRETKKGSTAHLNEQLRSPNLSCRVPCIRYEMELQLRPDFLQLPSRLSLQSHHTRQNDEEWKVGRPEGPTGQTTSYLP